MIRGIRGAVTVAGSDSRSVSGAVQELLSELTRRNAVALDEIASVLFSVTPDLQRCFPAAAAREMGWALVPMLHFVELAVPGSPAGVVRVLMHVETDRSPREVEHVYLGGAAELRPDIRRDAST